MEQKYKKTLTAHMMLCNEERWCWYAIMSVINYVDQMFIFDTGSSDNTVKIVNDIISHEEYAKKIVFEQRGKVDRATFVELRDEMVQRTTTDFFMVVDGDEVYYDRLMSDIRIALESEEDYQLGVIGFICCAGDVKHFRDPLKEHYRFGNMEGAITHRITSRKISGIRCGSPDGKWDGFYDVNGTYVVPDSGFKTFFVDGYYLHMSNMLRSSNKKKDSEVGWPSNRLQKIKEKSTWDGKFSKEFGYPEVFYLDRPEMVKNPWRMDGGLERILLQTIKSILLLFRKREIISNNHISVCYTIVKNCKEER